MFGNTMNKLNHEIFLQKYKNSRRVGGLGSLVFYGIMTMATLFYETIYSMQIWIES
jgi:hypothetical protein